VLFFSSRGMCYRMKVWRLPAAAPQSSGKALVNLLPLSEGEVITSILPLPEDRSTWGDLQLVFATRSGNVRRNALADFESIHRNGKIAMKLDEGDRIVQVEIASPEQDALLTSAGGQCVRFLIKDEVRLFKGRDSTGVRGIRLADGDEVISMAILNHFEASAEERAAYLKQASALRRADIDAEEPETINGGDAEVVSAEVVLSQERFEEMHVAEQFVLTVSDKGFGKRSSSFEFRTSGRGGKGIVAMVANERNGRLVASFPVGDDDQIMLVTNAGQLIRCPVNDIRIAGRNTQGVRIFKTDADEKVVSVERITDENGEDTAEEDGAVVE
jgi:DNA gyrase subunit A